MFIEQMPYDSRKHGWIEVICGSMFSGKTEELIRRLKRIQFTDQKIEVYKPKVDDRYHHTKVVSHDETDFEAITVENAAEIKEKFKRSDVVAIDEAQFFDEGLFEICNWLASQKVRVIVAGLDMDYSGKPFGPMPAIMATAEYVTKVHAICVKCGSLANFSYRITNNKDVIDVGEKDKYIPLCRSCFNKIEQ
ncbi:MAG: thymidine kinase [Crocinitomicaceae bacterium]|nr:thymidine kinase [Crocinitomicaceae bacterium]